MTVLTYWFGYYQQFFYWCWLRVRLFAIEVNMRAHHKCECISRNHVR